VQHSSAAGSRIEIVEEAGPRYLGARPIVGLLVSHAGIARTSADIMRWTCVHGEHHHRDGTMTWAIETHVVAGGSTVTLLEQALR
jgi:hypothetical protein